jgi:hypothetical protein
MLGLKRRHHGCRRLQRVATLKKEKRKRKTKKTDNICNGNIEKGNP